MIFSVELNIFLKVCEDQLKVEIYMYLCRASAREIRLGRGLQKI